MRFAFPWSWMTLGVAAGAGFVSSPAAVVFETTSPYHHIRVLDQGPLRILSFDRSVETRMSLLNPLAGHFEYTEYFHMPWLWNGELKKVLMIGLGGASTQRSFQHYYPDVQVDTVELDPTVVHVAKQFFFLKDSPRHQIHVSDGRVFLRRSHTKYDAIILDAYTSGRYGSQLPIHLVTKEFFELVESHLTPDGVVAYNVMGTLQGWQADIVGAVYKTMKAVLPQVYLFPSTESLNVVLIGTKNKEPFTLPKLQRQALEINRAGRVLLPSLLVRLQSFRVQPPPGALRAPLLTDDFAPVDGLISRGGRQGPEPVPQAPQKLLPRIPDSEVPLVKP